jgi:hypothetical protein
MTMLKRPLPEDYAPYHTYPAFNRGYNAYLKCNWDKPINLTGIDEQAYDRGAEYAMRVRQWSLAQQHKAMD